MLAHPASLAALSLALTPHGARPAGGAARSAVVEVVVDPSATLGDAPDAWLALFHETLAEARAGRPDLTILEHVVGPQKDAAGADCRPLARTMEEAAKELTARSERARLLVVVAGGMDTCGGDPCAVATKLVAAGSRRPRVVVAAADAAADALLCVGATAWAPGKASLLEALGDALADAGATTGVSAVRLAGAGKQQSVRFSLTPVEAHARTHLVAAGGGAAGGAPDVYAVPHGTYRFAVEGDAGAPALVRVTDGQVTTVMTGPGSLVVRLDNYWGAPLPADVEVWPHGAAASAATTDAPPAAPATAGATATAGSSRPHRPIPHTTMPVNPPREEAKGAATPAPAQAPAPAVAPPSGAPAPAAAAAAPAAPFARGRTDAPIDLPAGTYDVVVVRGGVVHRFHDVGIESGQRLECAIRFGGLKVVGATAGVHDRAGSMRGIAAPGRPLDLPAGTYALRSRDGSRTLAGEVEVRAGDVTIVELP